MWPFRKREPDREQRAAFPTVTAEYLSGRRSTVLQDGSAALSASVATAAGFWSRGFAPGFAAATRNRDHEYGHSVQSRWFGPLYLLVVGLPSVSRVFYSVYFHRRTGRSWNGYYSGWPEDHADRLGGVPPR